jgi:Cft2 family RNA processing exonuclease
MRIAATRQPALAFLARLLYPGIVPGLQIEYHHGAVWLPQCKLWLDAPRAQTGPERVFVSHAHADHIAAHREVLLSAATAELMRARLKAPPVKHRLDFGVPREFHTAGRPWRITLLPAGHILGSAMAYIEAEGQSLLYTGDFNLRPSRTAEPCESRRADVLIMETTFGQPGYRFPPREAVWQDLTRFCRQTLAQDETAVLLAYSLGKSQELLHGLADAGLPLMLHEAAHKITQVYERLGQRFPAYDQFAAEKARGKVLIWPPGAGLPAPTHVHGRWRRAVISGWAMDPRCRFRAGADAGFPLSDHADFDGLVEMVRRVAPRKVYTLHGFAADFAESLRWRGVDARPLGQADQLSLPLHGREVVAAKRG